MTRQKLFDYGGTAFPSALAFSSAYVEVACFIGLFGLFTSFITGDIILVGVELVEETPEIITRLLVLPLFVAACAFWSWTFRNAARPSPTAIRAALFTQSLLLLLALTFVANLGPLDGTDTPETMAVATPVVLACSLQMIMMRHQIISHPHTTVMTGNLGQLTISIASFYYGHLPDRPRNEQGKTISRQKTIRHQASVLVSFLAGALCGGLAFGAFGFACLFVPVAIQVAYALAGQISADS